MDNNFQRLIDTLQAIPLHHKVSTSDVVLRLKGCGYAVTQRTVQRDLEALANTYGLERDDRSKPYGWRWPDNIRRFSVPEMGWPEALSLYLVREHVQGLMPASVREHLAPYFNAADRKLQQHFSSTPIKRWPEKIRVTSPGQPLASPKVARAVRDTVTEALLNERQLDVHYRKAGAAELQRWQIHPLGLVQRGPIFYLAARLFDKPDAWTLALHRIEKARVLDEAALAPEGFTLDGWLQDAMGFGGDRTIRLVADFYDGAGKHLLESALAADQKVVALDDGDDTLRVTATVKDTEQLHWWLLAFGDRVEIKAPKSLRNNVAARVEAAAQRYKRKTHRGKP